MREGFVKKLLTIESKRGYSESLKLIKRLSHPLDLRFFCTPNGQSRVGNILNTNRVILIGFSEAAHAHTSVGLLKRIKKMTKSIKKSAESTILFPFLQRDNKVDFIQALGREKEALELINQIAGE